MIYVQIMTRKRKSELMIKQSSTLVQWLQYCHISFPCLCGSWPPPTDQVRFTGFTVFHVLHWCIFTWFSFMHLLMLGSRPTTQNDLISGCYSLAPSCPTSENYNNWWLMDTDHCAVNRLQCYWGHQRDVVDAAVQHSMWCPASACSPQLLWS